MLKHFNDSSVLRNTHLLMGGDPTMSSPAMLPQVYPWLYNFHLSEAQILTLIFEIATGTKAITYDNKHSAFPTLNSSAFI